MNGTRGRYKRLSKSGVTCIGTVMWHVTVDPSHELTWVITARKLVQPGYVQMQPIRGGISWFQDLQFVKNMK